MLLIRAEFDDDIYGAKKLLKPKLCKESWEASLLSAEAELDPTDRETLESVVQSIIDANGGKEVTPDVLEVNHQIAQKGVLRYIEKKRGRPISRTTRSSKLDKNLDQYIAEPCRRIVFKLTGIANEYFKLVIKNDPADHLDPKASELVRKA